MEIYSKNLTHAIRHLLQPFHHRNRRRSQDSLLPVLSHLLQIHSLFLVSGLADNSSLLTGLLLRCLSLPVFPASYALSIFDQIRHRDASIYNAAIRGFNSDPQMAVSIYARMRHDGILPNKHTFPLLLKSKTLIPFQILSHAIKHGFESDRYLRNSLISSLANCGRIGNTRQVFDEMTERDTIAYTALMDGYVKKAQALQALELFLEMRSSSGAGIDEVAVVTGLSAAGMSGCVWFGKWIHGFYVESGRVVHDVYIGTALVDMYSKCGYCDDAAKVFEEMPYRNVVSWNTLLSGYVQCDRCLDALILFRKMLVKKSEPNEAILAAVLTACASLGALDQGRWIDKYIRTRKLELNSVLGTALIDMYGKCGCVQDAFHVLDRMQVRDVYPWTAFIFGLGMNGDAKGALTAFSEMLRSGVWPNEVTFIAILSGCSHGGLVNQGQEIFALMEAVYGIKPTVDHYGCMVDLLGRAGCLEEAMAVIGDMPMEPSAGVWGALFGACMIHKDFELGKSVGNRLICLQPGHGGRYARLANLCGGYGDWEGAGNARWMMNKAGVEKTPGCSWVGTDGVVHEFVAFDKSHAACEGIYRVLDCLTHEIRGEFESSRGIKWTKPVTWSEFMD